MSTSHARFHVGQTVHHKLFDYRGVVADVDPVYQETDEWYETMARSRPPKDKPWYHVLVHGAVHRAYVAERNLEPDLSGEAIDHPEIDQVFEAFRDGLYVPRRTSN